MTRPPSSRHLGLLVDHVGRGQLAGRLAPGERGPDRRLEAFGLGRLPLVAAVQERRHDALGEQLERLADVFVAVASRLQHEDHLVDAGLLVAPNEI